MTNPSIPPCPVCDDLKLQLLSTTAYLRDAQKQIAQLNDRLAPDPRVAVLENICKNAIWALGEHSDDGSKRRYYELQNELIAAQRGGVDG